MQVAQPIALGVFEGVEGTAEDAQAQDLVAGLAEALHASPALRAGEDLAEGPIHAELCRDSGCRCVTGYG